MRDENKLTAADKNVDEKKKVENKTDSFLKINCRKHLILL